MGVEDQVIRLVHEQVGVEGVQKAREGYADLKGATDKAGQSFYDLAESAEHAGRADYELANTVAIVTAKASESKPALSAVDLAMEEIAGSSERAAANLKKVATAAETAKKGAGNLSQGVTAAGYAFQDFTSTSGDLGAKLNSITNNLPQLLAGLGVGGPLGAGVAALSVGAIVLYRNWDSLTGLFEEQNPFPEAARDVRVMSGELEKAKDAMKKLEENSSLTASQLTKYNELRATTAKLEREVADAQERQAVVKRGLESQGEDQKGRAEAFGKAQAGNGEDVLGRLKEAFEQEGRREIAGGRQASDKRISAEYDKFQAGGTSLKDLESFIAEEKERIATSLSLLKSSASKNAEDLYHDLLTGAKGADKRFAAIRGNSSVNFDDVAEKYTANLPETKKAAEKAKEEGKAAEAAAKKAAAKTAKNEDEWNAGVAAQDKAAAAEVGKNVKELLDDVGEELKAAAELLAKGGMDKAGIAAKLKDDATKAAAANGLDADDAAEAGAAASDKVADDATDSKARGRRRRTSEQAVKKQTDADVAVVSKETPIDEHAAALAAQVRARGKGTDAQQRAYVAKEVSKALADAGLGGKRNRAASEAVAGKAFKTADDSALAAGVNQQNRAGQAGLNNQAKLIAVAQQLTMQAANATQVQMQHSQAIDRLQRDGAVNRGSMQRLAR